MNRRLPSRVTRHAGLRPAPDRARHHHPDYNKLETQGWKAMDAEGRLSSEGWNREMKWALDMGLPGAESLEDRSIPTFSRGEKPHFAGINTFLKAPYVENIRDVGKYDAAMMGVPFDGGATYRPGLAVRAAGSAAHLGPLHALQLRDRGRSARADDALRRRRRFRDPGNLEKSFDQITRGVSHVFSSGALPVIIGGDHSIGFPTVRGIAECTSKKIGIIHFDRHIDMQAKDMDERMHNTPWYWVTELPNVSAKNLVQLGIGGWQVPRYGVAGGAQAREQRPDDQGHRDARHGEDRRDRARSRLGRHRRGLHLLRHRCDRLRLRAGHRMARTGRLSAARGAASSSVWSRPRASAGSRWSRSRPATTPPTSPR